MLNSQIQELASPNLIFFYSHIFKLNFLTFSFQNYLYSIDVAFIIIVIVVVVVIIDFIINLGYFDIQIIFNQHWDQRKNHILLLSMFFAC